MAHGSGRIIFPAYMDIMLSVYLKVRSNGNNVLSDLFCTMWVQRL